MSLVVLGALITSTVAPALVDVPATPAAVELDNTPTTPDDPAPSALAFGVYVSGLAEGAEPIWEPSPMARAHAVLGRTEEGATGARVLVRSQDGTDTLADVRGLQGLAVGRAEPWALQARAHMRVAWASLLDGAVTAQLLNAQVFSSNGFRHETGESRLAEVSVLGQRISVENVDEDGIPLLGIGVLYLNQTVVAPCGGLSPCPWPGNPVMVAKYSLRLVLEDGLEIIVGGAHAMTDRMRPGLGTHCWTWSEGYPLGAKGRLLSTVADARHNAIMSDVMEAGESSGFIDNVAIEGMPSLIDVDVAAATHESTIALDAGTATQLASASVDTDVVGLALLNGQIKADLVRATAHGNLALQLGGGEVNVTGPFVAEANALGSVLVGLKVGNTRINTTPDPNFEVALTVGTPPRTVARVILNEQTHEESFDAEAGVATTVQRTNMIRVVITGHDLGLDVGDMIVVGHAIVITSCGVDHMPHMEMPDFGDPLGLRPA